MADPLSLTASIVAVLGAAGTSCKALERLHRSRRAPREVGELLVELATFRALLEETKELSAQKPDLPCGQQLQPLVVRGGDFLGEITTITEQTWPSVHFLKQSEANRHRLTVLADGTRLKELKDNLRLVSLDLAAALSLVSAYVNPKRIWKIPLSFASLGSADCFARSSSVQMLDSTAESAELHAHNSNALSTLLQKVTLIEENTRQLQEATGRIVVPMTDYVSAMTRLDLADSVTDHSVPSSLALTLTPDLDDASTPYDGPRRASDPSSDQSHIATSPWQSCIDWCSCQCHARRTVGSPWALRSLLGQLVVERASTGPPCNEKSCRRWLKSSTGVTYHPPSFLSRYLRLVARHSPWDGLNLSVRMPRVMEWQHELWKHANVGNLGAIKALFSEGRASPYDVNPRGSNALIYAAAHGNPRVAQFLLQAGADPELTDTSGCKPVELFYERAFSGQFDEHGQHLVKSIFKGTGFTEDRKFTAIHKL
ncbi:MAG: hypothetical protein Q9183_005449, partial [Haloplaca sp. 2 TL-2023]